MFLTSAFIPILWSVGLMTQNVAPKHVTLRPRHPVVWLPFAGGDNLRGNEFFFFLIIIKYTAFINNIYYNFDLNILQTNYNINNSPVYNCD